MNILKISVLLLIFINLGKNQSKYYKYDSISIFSSKIDKTESKNFIIGNNVEIIFEENNEVYAINFSNQDDPNLLAFKRIDNDTVYNIYSEGKEKYRVYDSLSSGNGIKFISKTVSDKNETYLYGYEIFNKDSIE